MSPQLSWFRVLISAILACMMASCERTELKPVCTADELVELMDQCLSYDGAFIGCTHGTVDQVSCADMRAENGSGFCSVSYESPCITSCQIGEVDVNDTEQQTVCRSEEE
jgi:hypothetical protein